MPRLSYNLELIFLSTPSARRATEPWEACSLRLWISIHALREEGDKGQAGIYQHREISIHALREEGDCCAQSVRTSATIFLSTPSARRATLLPAGAPAPVCVFLSTPSARRATSCARLAAGNRSISIHALREEGDAGAVRAVEALEQFLSTPSARRATRCPPSGCRS